MKESRISMGYRCLENAGWSDLIDIKWKEEVIKELKKEVPDITEDEINEILETVLW